MEYNPTNTVPHILIRLIFAALLCFFGFAPVYIAWGIFVQIIRSPLEIPFAAYVIFFVCVPLIYFFGVLAWRTLTWRLRRRDGGLVPPLVMHVFIVFFGLVGVIGLFLTIWHAEYLKSILAIGYIVAAISTFNAARSPRSHNQKNPKLSEKKSSVDH